MVEGEKKRLKGSGFVHSLFCVCWAVPFLSFFLDSFLLSKCDTIQSVWKRETSALCYITLDCLLTYVLFHCSISFDSISDPHHFHLWLRVCGWPCVQGAGLESYKYCHLCPDTDLAFNIFHVGTFLKTFQCI